LGRISASDLWPLLQVFVQFAREVQGGSVRRLVFRNPKEYAPTVKRFQSMPHRDENVGKPPFVIHVAYDDFFVVTVSETMRDTCTKSVQEDEAEENLSESTIAGFCEYVLNYLAREQAEFLATLALQDLVSPRPDNVLPNSYTAEGYQDSENDVHGDASTQEYTLRASGSSSASGGNMPPAGGRKAFPDGDLPQIARRNPVVMVNEENLSEFIKKAQHDIRM